jgi:hypothetical protein
MNFTDHKLINFFVIAYFRSPLIARANQPTNGFMFTCLRTEFIGQQTDLVAARVSKINYLAISYFLYANHR